MEVCCVNVINIMEKIYTKDGENLKVTQTIEVAQYYSPDFIDGQIARLEGELTEARTLKTQADQLGIQADPVEVEPIPE